MRGLGRLRAMLAGIALIVVSNAGIFATVAYNRSGEPDGRVTLTERELHLPYASAFGKENSGIDLRIAYRIKGAEVGSPALGGGGESRWLGRDKLVALGFDVTPPQRSDIASLYTVAVTTKEAILVLEYDADAYRQALRLAEQEFAAKEAKAKEQPADNNLAYQLKQARETLEDIRHSQSRLYIIDVGLDHDTLRQQYADRSRYLLLKGIIGLRLEGTDSESPQLLGVIRGLSKDVVHVPSAYQALLQPFLEQDLGLTRGKAPRYAVDFNIGKRLEPWLSGIAPLSAGANE